MSWFERRAEEILRDAIDRGEFDGLEGAGKPLRLDSSPLVPAELKLAYKMLRDAGYLPPELELKQEIVTLRELLRVVTDEDERYRLARRLNDRVLQLNLSLKRSFDVDDQQVYARKVRKKLAPPDGAAR